MRDREGDDSVTLILTKMQVEMVVLEAIATRCKLSEMLHPQASIVDCSLMAAFGCDCCLLK